MWQWGLGCNGSMNPVVLFDGRCNLCAGSVQWIIRRDKAGVFRFAALDSEVGREMLAGYGKLPDSLLLVDEEGVHTQSTAALRIAGRLGWPWSWARVGLWAPKGWRDGVYRWVARNRYRWFGRREACWAPTAELRGRFLSRNRRG
jgi:predicted DCC family thiol-disulfide oxidoreductase YuxK